MTFRTERSFRGVGRLPGSLRWAAGDVVLTAVFGEVVDRFRLWRRGARGGVHGRLLRRGYVGGGIDQFVGSSRKGL